MRLSHESQLYRPLILSMVVVNGSVALLGALLSFAAIAYMVFEKKKDLMMDDLAHRVALVTAVLDFDAKHSQHVFPGGSLEATLSQVVEADRYRYNNRRYTVYYLYQVTDDGFHVLSHTQQAVSVSEDQLYVDASLKERYAQALRQDIPVIIHRDAEGRRYLLAFAPLNDAANLGMAAQVPLQVLLAPFMRASAYVLVIGAIMSAFSSLLSIAIGRFLLSRIREREKWFEQILQNSPTGIGLRDLSGKVVTVNPKLCEFLGMEPEELIGTKVNAIVDKDDAERDNQAFQDLIEGKVKMYSMHKRYRRKDGTIFQGLSSVSILENEDELPLYGIGIVQDITERIELEDRLRAERDRAEAALHTKDSFLSVMSHELRTPLNPIIGFTELLMTTGNAELDSETTTEYLEIIHHSGHRLLNIINNILRYSKLDKRTYQATFAEVDLYLLCHEIFENTKIGNKTITLDCQNGFAGHAAIQPDSIVMTDMTMVRHLLGNLLENAIKFTHEGQVIFKFGREPSDDPQQSFYHFAIKDTGIGIDAAHLKTIFDPFVQVDDRLSRDYEGLGLGLATSWRISELLGGSISVTSELGTGSEFSIVIPMKDVVLIEESTMAMEATEAVQARPQILVVEDNLENQLVAKALVERFGGEVTVAKDGVEGVELADQHPYALILMDLRMPKLNGIEAATAIIEGDGPNHKTPIVALTAHVSQQIRNDCINAGMVDYLAKPIRPDDLNRALQKWL